MSRLTIIAVGGSKSSWARTVERTYCRRLHRWKAEIQVVKAGSGNEVKKIEAKRIITLIPKNAKVIVLVERGQKLSSKQFARKVDTTIRRNPLCFIIGGAFGLDDSVIKKADVELSVSQFTLSHDVARVVLLEQCYRAWTIINNHPYHKE